MIHLQRLPSELCCPAHGACLYAGTSGAENLCCPHGCEFPIKDGIPRFVSSDDYADRFGWQWRAFQRIQLDSYTGTSVTRDRLTRCLGGDLGIVRDKSVLEAGCGAGRFTEILLDARARVFACDLSRAVDAAFANFGPRSDYFVCQADIRCLPALKASFDVVICLGVVQHTPNPEATIAALAAQVRPGGFLVFDHYSLDYPYTLPRMILRRINLRLPPALASRLTIWLARLLVRLHSRYWVQGEPAVLKRRRLQKYSPLVDYFDGYPFLRREILEQWCILDTHDTVTDRYKHLRSAVQIRDAITALGFEIVSVAEGGNGIEACARRPAADPADVQGRRK